MSIVSADRATELAVQKLHDFIHEGPQDSRSSVLKMLDQYSAEDWSRDGAEVLVLGGAGYEDRLLQFRELLSDIEELRADFNDPRTSSSEHTGKDIYKLKARIGQLVWESVKAFAEGWE